MNAQNPPHQASGQHRAITVGPFHVTDLDRTSLLHALAANRGNQTIVYSLHVGGLNLRHDDTFTATLNTAEMVLPDGISVAALVKLAGGGLHRHPTTDLGWEILSVLAAQNGRATRVALIGGPEELASRAGDVIANNSNSETVYTNHGFHTDWAPVLAELGPAKPDVVFVGMGMPYEARWVEAHRHELPQALIITCGGWFGHVVGDEKRAPAWMRKAGLEWMARLAQSPGRLWRRYTSGLWSTIAMMPTALKSRFRKRPDGPLAAPAPQKASMPQPPAPIPPGQHDQMVPKE